MLIANAVDVVFHQAVTFSERHERGQALKREWFPQAEGSYWLVSLILVPGTDRLRAAFEVGLAGVSGAWLQRTRF